MCCGGSFFDTPRIEVGKITTLPFTAAKVKVYFYLLPFFAGVNEGATVLRELEFDILRVIAVHYFEHEFAGLESGGFAFGIVFFQ